VGIALLAVAGVLLANRHSSAPARHTHISAGRVGVSRAGTRSRVSARNPAALVWRAAWGSPMAWAQPGVIASDTTVRELATVALGGKAVKVRISNLFGDAPLVVGAGTVAVSSGGGAIIASTLKRLAFNRRPSITIPVGRVAYSDATQSTVAGGQTLAVTVYVRDSDLVTLHPYGNLGAVSFAAGNGSGNQVDSVTGTAFPDASPWPRWVDAVDVLERRGQGAHRVLQGLKPHRLSRARAVRVPGIPVSFPTRPESKRRLVSQLRSGRQRLRGEGDQSQDQALAAARAERADPGRPRSSDQPDGAELDRLLWPLLPV
jgi:hypothetical protein